MLKELFLSIIIIFLLHYIWNYLVNTYSTKKTKDLVNSQVQKYKQIIKDMENQDQKSNISQGSPTFLNNLEKEEMERELSELLV
jgi:hypothetical protein